jgi:hypothetical protein
MQKDIIRHQKNDDGPWDLSNKEVYRFVVQVDGALQLIRALTEGGIQEAETKTAVISFAYESGFSSHGERGLLEMLSWVLSQSFMFGRSDPEINVHGFYTLLLILRAAYVVKFIYQARSPGPGIKEDALDGGTGLVYMS